MLTGKKLAAELYRSVFEDPWHGSSLKDILDNCSAAKVYQRPVKDAHNIIELVLHLNSWTEEIISRLEDNPPSEPAQGDWPTPAKETEEYWNETTSKFYSGTKMLISILENISDEKLDKMIGEERSQEFGTGFTAAEMVIGLLQHNAYHAGQISLLNK